MEFERQKPVSDEYRENWDRIFITGSGTNIGAFRVDSGTIQSYPNGCPILSEGPQKDDI